MDWKEFFKPNKQKIILLFIFLLFLPSPLILFIINGIVPVAFELVFIKGLLLAAITDWSFSFTILAFIVLLLNIAFGLFINYFIVCFLYKHLKNRYYLWSLVGVLILISLFFNIYWLRELLQGSGGSCNLRTLITERWCTPKSCDDILYKPSREKCRAKLQQEIADCDKIEYNFSRDGCYVRLGVQNQYVSACEKIKDDGVRHNCYLSISKRKKDIAFCDSIQDQVGKDACYIGIITTKSDPAICDKIHNEIWKDSCYKNTAQ